MNDRTPLRWGLVATVKAPLRDIQRFAAYHLELGAHRVALYLDDPDPDTHAKLNAHPKVRVTACDDAYWRKSGGKRPVKHQVRQSRNATHAYARRSDVDWLIHMDVDEFLWPDSSVSELLAALAADTLCARARPVENLSGSADAFKAHIPAGPDRARIVERLYPVYGKYLKGGFLSHVAGKLFVRTGLPAMELRIHNMFRDGEMNPGEVELNDLKLCHLHAPDWDSWKAQFQYRLAKGSYRADLPAAAPNIDSLHTLLAGIDARSGESGLRVFFEEVAADTPDLRNRLQAERLLLRHDLELDAAMARQFDT